MINLVLLVIWFAACTAQDLYQRHISNVLTLGALCLALLYLVGTGHTWLGANAAEGGWALLIVLILTLPGYTLNKFGAGDVKLLSALALATDRLMVLGTLIGAGLWVAIAWVTASKILPLLNQPLKLPGTHLTCAPSKKLPFAPFLFGGFILTLMRYI